MKIKNDLIKYIIINIFILIIIYLFYIANIRICLVYNLLKIPCPGCGLTTSVMYLIKGDILGSLQYNIITIPLILIYIIGNGWYIIDLIKNKQTLNQFINKNKILIIVVSVILFIISGVSNIANPLLY